MDSIFDPGRLWILYWDRYFYKSDLLSENGFGMAVCDRKYDLYHTFCAGDEQTAEKKGVLIMVNIKRQRSRIKKITMVLAVVILTVMFLLSVSGQGMADVIGENDLDPKKVQSEDLALVHM